jgi:hypothetical protein
VHGDSPSCSSIGVSLFGEYIEKKLHREERESTLTDNSEREGISRLFPLLKVSKKSCLTFMAIKSKRNKNQLFSFKKALLIFETCNQSKVSLQEILAKINKYKAKEAHVKVHSLPTRTQL